MFHNGLISPDNRMPLSLDEQRNHLHTNDKRFSYPIIKGVPILLPKEALKIKDNTRQHQQFGSEFNYLDHYNKDAELFDYFDTPTDGPTMHENRRLHEMIMQEIKTPKATILDVGCGSAWVAKKLCPKGNSVCSLDVSPKNTQEAIERYPYDNHRAVVGDVFNLPFAANSFDYIIAAEIIEHVANPKLFIEKLLAVLKPDGKLIISTPYNEKIVYYLCVHCNRPTPQHAHLHSFDEKGIMNLVPAKYQKSTQASAFSNKGLLVLRSHLLLKYLPLSLWRWFDRLANRIFRRPLRLLLIVDKK